MNMKDTHFLCIGLIMQDVLLKGINKLPHHWEETVSGKVMISDVGGGAANSAITFGRLGCKAAVAGRIGNDSFGRLLKKKFAEEGVSTEYLKTDTGKSTGVSVGIVNDYGERCFLTVKGCNEALCFADFQDIDFSLYQYVHINGYFQFPALENEMAQLLSRIKESGCVVSFDMASWDPSGKWYKTIHPFAEYIDYFFANTSQLKELTGEADTEAAAEILLKDSVKNVIAKLGANGSVHYRPERSAVEIDAIEVEVEDTTGAGDSFDSAYMLAVSQGLSLKKCGAFANTVAGMNCGKLGATAGVPDFNTAQNEMNNFYGIMED